MLREDRCPRPHSKCHSLDLRLDLLGSKPGPLSYISSPETPGTQMPQDKPNLTPLVEDQRETVPRAFHNVQLKMNVCTSKME